MHGPPGAAQLRRLRRVHLGRDARRTSAGYRRGFCGNGLHVIGPTLGGSVPVGTSPAAVAVDPLIDDAYVANSGDGTVSVIDGATNTVTGPPIGVGTDPVAVAADSSDNVVFVANAGSDKMSVIS